MIRVLQVVNNMHRAGLETMLMNYYRNIDRTQIQFDFLTHRPQKDDYDEEIESLGGTVYHAPRLYPQNYPAYFQYMKRFFTEHPEYQIVHSHIDAMSYLPLLTAKHAGVPVRIAHSHSTSIDRDFKYFLKQFFRTQIPSVANVYFACGGEAGKFLFRARDFQVIPNAVDAQQFYFQPETRKQKRQELAVEGKLVVGHVGRISYVKNHKFLIEIFYEIKKQNPDAVLLLAGVGEKETEVRSQVHALGLDSQVHFLGSRSDVNALYQAMDVFVMPSFFEGIPMVGIEAQISGLPCVFSDGVPKEICFGRQSHFLSLQEPAKTWADAVLAAVGEERNTDDAAVQTSGYDIRFAHSMLEEKYLSLLNQYGRM